MAEFKLETSFNNLKPGELGKISLDLGENKTINIAAKKSLGQLELFFNQFTQNWKNVEIAKGQHAWIKVSDFTKKTHLGNIDKKSADEIIGNKDLTAKKLTKFKTNNIEIQRSIGYLPQSLRPKEISETNYEKLQLGVLTDNITNLLRNNPDSYLIVPRKVEKYDAFFGPSYEPLEGEYYVVQYDSYYDEVLINELSATSEGISMNGKTYAGKNYGLPGTTGREPELHPLSYSLQLRQLQSEFKEGFQAEITTISNLRYPNDPKYEPSYKKDIALKLTPVEDSSYKHNFSIEITKSGFTIFDPLHREIAQLNPNELNKGNVLNKIQEYNNKQINSSVLTQDPTSIEDSIFNIMKFSASKENKSILDVQIGNIKHSYEVIATPQGFLVKNAKNTKGKHVFYPTFELAVLNIKNSLAKLHLKDKPAGKFVTYQFPSKIVNNQEFRRYELIRKTGDEQFESYRIIENEGPTYDIQAYRKPTFFSLGKFKWKIAGGGFQTIGRNLQDVDSIEKFMEESSKTKPELVLVDFDEDEEDWDQIIKETDKKIGEK